MEEKLSKNAIVERLEKLLCPKRCEFNLTSFKYIKGTQRNQITQLVLLLIIFRPQNSNSLIYPFHIEYRRQNESVFKLVYLYLQKAIATRNPGDTNRLYTTILRYTICNISSRFHCPLYVADTMLLIGWITDISRSDAAKAIIKPS